MSFTNHRRWVCLSLVTALYWSVFEITSGYIVQAQFHTTNTLALRNYKRHASVTMANTSTRGQFKTPGQTEHVHGRGMSGKPQAGKHRRDP